MGQGQGIGLAAGDFRQALGCFPTGVTVVTCMSADGPIGLTVNSFSALSLEPPLVLWTLKQSSPNRALFETAEWFAVNILAERQQDISVRFASKVADRFAGLRWRPGRRGAPLLEGCAACLECVRVASLEGGDHRIFVGRVEELAKNDRRPLLFHAGQYRIVGEVLESATLQR